MGFDRYYLVLLRKGPTWAPGETPELEALQERHLAHIRRMAEMGKLASVGPVEAHDDSDLRGIHILYYDQFASLDELRALVEQDPAVQAGRLRAEVFTWYAPQGSNLRLPDQNAA